MPLLRRLPSLTAVLLLCLSACTAEPTGSVQFAASAQQALSAGDVTRVKVTVSASDMTSVEADLAPSNGSWGGLIGNIPAGTNRAFLAEAFDASGILRFRGQASGVVVAPNQTTAVALTLQEVSPPPPYGNEAPLIDSLVASSTSVQTGASLSLTAAAHDLNTSDSLTLAWTATGGTFSAPTAATTSWTAPSSVGIQTLTLTVTDSQGSVVSVSLAINVTSGTSTHADLDVSFNLWPVVSRVSASPSRLDVGQSTTVSTLASDGNGEALSYQWTASCPGTWTNATSNAASFIPSSVPAGDCNNCRLTVTVQDGSGGQTTGFINLCVAAVTPERFPPSFTGYAQSASPLSPGQTVTFDVTALDPQASALTFAWTASTGSLAPAQSTATTSRVAWTAPSCARRTAPPSITATVTNAYGRSASTSFSPSGLPACVDAWASGGAMAQGRYAHVATPLSSGKVLVSGGLNGNGNNGLATAALYDPTSGTWSAAASMTSARSYYSATLLPSGKVLVAGGWSGSAYLATAEVYDPTTGTWSAAPSMPSPRAHHTATPLPNGKILFAGGVVASTGVVLYDPTSGTWSAAASMASARYEHTATLLPNGKVLVSGGFTGSGRSGPLATAEVYDPSSGTWSAAPPMASPRGGHTATRLANGKVLVAGGHNGSNYLTTAALYDPDSGTWSAAPPMASARYLYTATMLANDTVLISGGYNSSGPLTAAELYDPASGTWSAAASMASGRSEHTATPLPNGKVLISGGQGTSGTLAAAELYAP